MGSHSVGGRQGIFQTSNAIPDPRRVPGVLRYGLLLQIDRDPVYPGELGVLWRMLGGGTQIDTVYREGMHLILPFNKMYVYNVRKQQFTDSIDVLTVDGLTVGVQVFRALLPGEGHSAAVAPARWTGLCERGGEARGQVGDADRFRTVQARGNLHQPEVHPGARQANSRRAAWEARFVSLDEVPIESVTLPAKISDAIEAKLAQQQIDQEYAYRIDIAAKEADRKRIEAAGIRDSNNTINASLTPSVLAWQGISATQELAKSPNAKIVVIGAGKSGLPLILGNRMSMKRLLLLCCRPECWRTLSSPQWRSFDRMGQRRFQALSQMPKEILVGVCWPFSARQDGMADGLQLAQEEINAAGLARGIPIRLVMRDDKVDWERAKNIAIEFSDTPRMSAVLGYYDSSLAIKASTMYEPSRLLHLMVGANATSLTSHAFDYIVRTILSSDKIARALARFTVARGHRKIAIIWEEGAYGEDLAYQYQIALSALGDVELVYQWSYTRELADFRLPVNELKGADADLIFFAGLEPLGGRFLANGSCGWHQDEDHWRVHRHARDARTSRDRRWRVRCTSTTTT